MNVCFIGIGSIAKRHIKNLIKICSEDNIEISIDAVSRSGVKGSDDVFKYIEKVFRSVQELTRIYDVFFITNPTEYHIETLEKVTAIGKNFFIEKPIASLSQIEKASKYTMKKDAVYYVACPLRYNAVIQHIKSNVRPEDVISVRSISSSYLPDWRPGQNYRDTYSAHKELGGGVSIDLIHEWDYLTFLFGIPKRINYMGGRISNLEIDSDDYAIYIGEYKDKIVELHLDYFGRKTIREVMIFTKDETIVGNIADNKIDFLKSGKIIDFKEERDDYQIKEIKHFIDMIDRKCEQDSNIYHAIEILKLTQGKLR